ncbi:hypothetical protein D3C76_1778990 [compost metagenome]
MQEIESRINHTRTRGVVSLRHALNLFNQLIAVTGVAGENIQNHQAQLAVAKEALAASATATVMLPATAMMVVFVAKIVV